MNSMAKDQKENGPTEVLSLRLPKIEMDALNRQAGILHTTKNWIVRKCLIMNLSHLLPAGYDMRPYREHDKE